MVNQNGRITQARSGTVPAPRLFNRLDYKTVAQAYPLLSSYSSPNLEDNVRSSGESRKRFMYATKAGRSRIGTGWDNNVAQPVSAIRAFYQHLCQTGKVKTLAWIAHIGKLRSVLNAMLKSGMPWQVAASHPT